MKRFALLLIMGIPLLLAIVAFYSFDFCLRVGGIVSLPPHGASVTHRMINDLDHPFLFPRWFYTNKYVFIILLISCEVID